MPGVVHDMQHLTLQETPRSRLNELCEEWGINRAPLASPGFRPEQPASTRTENDDAYAEELLKRQRLAESQNSSSKSGLSRAFTTKKKAWEYKEIYTALVDHVSHQGSPGVAEALIAKLNLVGGNVNLAQKSRTSLITRRKSLDLAERSQVLQCAVENGQVEMVRTLLPFADALSLDTSLPVALRNRDTATVSLLVRYGASAVQTADGQDAFRQACAVGGQADLLIPVLSSDGRPPASWLSQCMVEATRAGCLDTVVALSQSTADGNFDGAAALKTAIAMGRRDITVAIVAGSKPPIRTGLNEAFEQLMGQQNMNPKEKLAMTEALLCAGADGEAVARSLVQACATDFLEMVHLLVSYGASIEYDDAIAVRKAISGGKTDMAEVLLNEKSSLNSAIASECVELLPKKMRFEERHSFLTMLLRKGAQGPPLDEALVDVTEAGDVESARLLLRPLFPSGKVVGKHSLKTGPKSMVFDKHSTASTNHKGGLALQIAVKQGNVTIIKLILDHPPAQPIMAQVFPSARTLPRQDRYQITEAFLRAGLSGPPVHSALQNAIDEAPPHRDEHLIALLLRSNADVNFNEGAGITAAISQRDVGLLSRLLKSRPTPDIAGKALAKAIEVEDQAKRYLIIKMLLAAGATTGGEQVSVVLSSVLQSKPVDQELTRLLLEQGQADVNAQGGKAMAFAVQNPDPQILDMVLSLGHPTAETLDRTMRGLGQVPSSPTKAAKLGALLKRTSSKGTINNLLVEEVQSVVQVSPDKRNLSVFKTLLHNGADVNAANAEALCRAVAASSMQMVDLLFACHPDANSLSFAMPHALRIRDSMDRLAFAQKILHGGMPPLEVNRALVFALSTYPGDLPLINTLLGHADTQDGLALMEAIKSEKQDVVDLMLGKKSFSPTVLNQGFVQATRGKDKRQRGLSCSSLIKAGATSEVVSGALVAAASDGDLEFGTMLVQNGGSVDFNDGQAVIEACRSGAAEVLEMLLSGDAGVSQATLQKGFQAATEVSDLNKRAAVFKLLLQRGVTGEVVDAQLVSAGRFGDSGTDLVRLLLVYGASPDFNDGEAVEKATKSAFLDNLQMLLGVVEVGGRQKKPSSSTLVRALNGCWNLQRDTRFTVIEWIFKAGKPVPSAVHTALTRVVNEEEPEERLIRLLVANRASPTSNGCQTLIDATRTLSASQFAELLESRVTPEDASFAFGKTFVPEHASSWMSERGYEIAKCLLKKGAGGAAVRSALMAVLGAYSESQGQVVTDFVDLLLGYDPDINHNNGEALQLAASKGDAALLRRLLEQNPSSEALTLAFPKIFDANISDDGVYELISLFNETSAGTGRVDVMFNYPSSDPVIYRALSRYPRSTKILQALLDLGYYHEQMIHARVHPSVEEEEEVSTLLWALLQPQKRISSAVIILIIENGGNVNYKTAISHVTPLMVAIQAWRPDLVKSLILAGAEVDVTDATGCSPLSLASAAGGDLAITMMSNLLAAGASRNDGSLHNASRELNVPAMQILTEYGHDPDFPSTQHDGRSALGELCLHAADSGEVGPRDKMMEKAITFLLQDSDMTLQVDGKSVLLLALESADPIGTAKVLLRAGMWKHVNKPFNQYTDGTFTYSPTQYVSRVLPESRHTPGLLKLLKDNRAKDVFYANSGPQPEGAAGMPSHIEMEEQERKMRAARINKENEEHARAIARSKELASVQAQIMANQAELEEARRKRAHGADLLAIQDRARLEEEVFSKALAAQRAKQSQEVAHQQALTQSQTEHVRRVGEAELAIEGQKNSRLLEFERQVGGERVGNASQLSSIRLREREEVERMDSAADGRFRERVKAQKQLVESQSQLAGQLGNGGVARRQIGYVAGELD